MSKIRAYQFTRPMFGYSGSVELRRIGEHYESATKLLSPAEYDRFVQVANTGNYAVEILCSDYGLAWEMRRKGGAA